MGLFVGIVVIFIGFVGSILIILANAMSDAPSKNSIPIYRWLVPCLSLGIFFIVTHYHPISW